MAISIYMKTWGQGPGGATALYWDGLRVRRLSPWEALRTHSFPEAFISWLKQRRDVTWEEAYRLCGNSIPIGMLTDVISHIISIIKPQVLSALAAARDRHEGRRKPDHRSPIPTREGRRRRGGRRTPSCPRGGAAPRRAASHARC